MRSADDFKESLNAVNRKSGAGINAKDLCGIINPANLVETENLTTLIVQVPKLKTEEWMDSYETLSSFVVPRSSQVLHVEGDNELRSVVLFRRVVDAFINAARRWDVPLVNIPTTPRLRAPQRNRRVRWSKK